MTFENSSLFIHYIFIHLLYLLVKDYILSDPIDNEESASDVELNIDESVISNRENISTEYVYKIIELFADKQMFYDKYTSKYINEVIDKQYELEKDNNLKFIEELDKESRQSFKALLMIGSESYKSLASKNREIIDEENIDNEEDNLRQLAENELGENYTEEQYQDFSEQNRKNKAEDKMVQDEARTEYLQDDDGDNFDEDQNDYYNQEI